MAFSADDVRSRPVRCLHFARIAPGRPYHAALSITKASGARGFRVTEHSHDFYEMLFVLAGDAIHGVNGTTSLLRLSDLILLRPGDGHFLRFQTGRMLHYINIAIEATLWENFYRLTGGDALLNAPVTRSLNALANAEGTVPAAEECAAAFQRALVRFQDTQTTNAALRTEACRLLAIVAPYLLPDMRQDGDPDELRNAPPWLKKACKKLQHNSDALRCGLPAFVAEAGVSRTHLARVLKSAIHKTPTEYVNSLRLARAARLLTTTSLSILDVAEECGFEQPTYFYRLFRTRFHDSPHAYRIAAAHRVTPK